MSTTTGKDILDYGLRRANELKTEQNDDFVPDLKDYINLAYWDIVGEFPWLWSVKYPPYQLTTIVSITVAATTTAGSVMAVLGADPGNVIGRKLMVDDDGVAMRILDQHTVNLTLAAPYANTLSGAGARIYQDEYLLDSDILVPLQMKRLKSGGELELLQTELFTSRFKRNSAPSRPVAYTFLTDRVIQIGPWPELTETLEFWYTATPPALDFSGSAATDTPILPFNIRWVIADRALFYLLSDMEDPKAASIIANSSVRLAQEKDRHATKWKPQFWIPRQFRIARSRI